MVFAILMPNTISVVFWGFAAARRQGVFTRLYTIQVMRSPANTLPGKAGRDTNNKCQFHGKCIYKNTVDAIYT